MLKLLNIKKDYVAKDQPTVHALKGVSLNFRRNEFVAILGQSGCGKTTLLNIIGGLDRYTSGDLAIEGVSTKQYTDRDWDTYRNHSIGFVFQSYNLIMHINVLQNVELALTVSGISKKERKIRALKALKDVGLEGLEKKKPNQLSGGQMQRVAIARALVNNPEILLADEPTGALDSETSIQIMNILKDVAKSRLVIMVTHNPDLAIEYATRIVRMSDGHIVDDSMPYEGEIKQELIKHKLNSQTPTKGKKQKTSMSLLTAFSLSWNNLMTKKGRTFLTSFAGSIGIIGIALILSVSFGFSEYIARVQTDALTSYPMTVNKETFDGMSMMGELLANSHTDGEKYPDSDVVGEDDVITSLVTSFAKSSGSNDTKGFKEFIEREDVIEKYGEHITAIQYQYDIAKTVYKEVDGNVEQVFPLDLTKGNYSDPMTKMAVSMVAEYLTSLIPESMFPIYSELIPNYDYEKNPDLNYNKILTEQYDVMYGKMPQEKNEIVIVVNEYNNIDDFMLFGLGLKSPQHMMETLALSFMPTLNIDPVEEEKFSMTYKELCDLTYHMPVSYTLYEKNSSNKFQLKTGDNLKTSLLSDINVELDVVGILRPKKNIAATTISGVVGYLPSLTQYLIEQVNNETNAGYDSVDTNVVMAQKAAPYNTYVVDGYSSSSELLYDLGVADLASPATILIYPVNFASKEHIYDMVNEFNSLKEAEVRENPDNASLTEEELSVEIAKTQIRITDTVGALMSSVQTIVDSISYVLIAFVSISLIVSSIMIGIITYVSVLERTKEIGVLRSIGARKHDISNVFNAETLIIGLTSGLIGIGVSLILDIPITLIIVALAQIAIQVVVPWYGIILLPIISTALTIISGLVPSKIAANKDPVVALRSE